MGTRMASWRVRGVTALLSTACAAAAALWLWPRLSGRSGADAPPPIRFVRGRGLPDGSAPPPAPPGSEARLAPATPEDWAFHIPYEDYKQAFPFYERSWLYDPWTYLRRAPHFDKLRDWDEHPAGSFRERANDLGLREDHDGLHADADLRVLVLGDSHAYGQCDNADSFANLLEASLAKSFARHEVEVLNAALGGFSFFQYAGTLHKLRAFRPQVVVLTVYAGNDFSEFGYFEHFFAGSAQPVWPAEALSARDEAIAAAPTAMGQCFNSIWTWRTHPAEVETLTAAAVRHTLELDEIARLGGAALIVALLPAPCGFAWEDEPPEIGTARELLGLTPADELVGVRMARDYLERVAASGVVTLDLEPVLAAAAAPPFWRADLHLDLEGHRRVAAALETWISENLK